MNERYNDMTNFDTRFIKPLSRIAAIVSATVILSGCSGNTVSNKGLLAVDDDADTSATAFTNDVMLGMTPVKDQGASSLCWAYAMLATIETEHIMRGDSVNLSPTYVARMFMKEQVDKCYTSHGRNRITTRGIMPQLIRIIQTYGLLPYDSYHTSSNINVAARKLQTAVRAQAARSNGIPTARAEAERVLDAAINPLPGHVYMFSMEYTPLEFAHSVCMPDEYIGFTSVQDEPYDKRVILPSNDNFNNDSFVNVPLNRMLQIMEKSVMNGHPVCWEGDTSESGFSFAKGIADVPLSDRMATQQKRQRGIDSFRTTDDHCMSIVGIAHDKKGRKFFVCKNSWGTENPFGGLVYMSFDYARMKTLAIMVNAIAINQN